MCIAGLTYGIDAAVNWHLAHAREIIGQTRSCENPDPN